MKRLISAKTAGNVLLVALALLAIFHVLILLEIVPSNIVWGGQIGDSTSNLVVLEITALLVTVIFGLVIAAKLDYVRSGRLRKAANAGMWIVTAYFLLNTIGNLASGVSAENLIFAPFTVLLTLLSLRLAIEK